jgi:hypothetical protein
MASETHLLRDCEWESAFSSFIAREVGIAMVIGIALSLLLGRLNQRPPDSVLHAHNFGSF